MKIGVDIRVLMDRQYSGISEYTASLLAAIKRLDDANEYRLLYNSWSDLSGRLDAWQSERFVVRATRWPNKVFNYFLQRICGWPKLDLVLGGVDLFWSPHFNFTSLSGPESGLKKIITVHDLSFLRYPEYFSGRKNFWHRALGVKKTLREAEAIVAVSENTKHDIIELADVSPDKIRVIYSGSSVHARDVSLDRTAAVLREKGIKGPYILYVGTIEPRKNIAGLIKAFDLLKSSSGSRFSELELVLAGAPGWKTKAIFKAHRESPYRDRIRFLGYVEAEVKEALYDAAAVFVYPSFYEGFGLPPLEAMSLGLPVVCSNVSSLPEVVGDAALLVNPYRPDEIATALKEILSDESLQRELSEKGRERARSFSWDKAARGYIDLFKMLKK